MVNVYEAVSHNKRKSIVLILLFVSFVGGVVWVMNQFLGVSANLVSWAVLFSFLTSGVSYFWGDKIILASLRAKPANKEEYFEVFTAVENLAIVARIPMPRVYIIQTPAMNAFATGRDPKHATICVTSGLVEKLNKSELEAVLAHEISHIVNFDIRLMTIVAVLVGMIVLLSDWLIRTRSLRNEVDEEGERSTNPVVLAISLVAIALAPIFAKLIQLAISRQREFLADASAVKLTRQPQALISALKKLALDNQPVPSANFATAPLFIINPFGKANSGINRLTTLFSTHPPIESRIAQLKKML